MALQLLALAPKHPFEQELNLAAQEEVFGKEPIDLRSLFGILLSQLGQFALHALVP
jgi:hypothetical protein